MKASGAATRPSGSNMLKLRPRPTAQGTCEECPMALLATPGLSLAPMQTDDA